MAFEFNQIWIENRFRYRKRMSGATLRLDPTTGYLEPTKKRGFSAEMKKTFIQRFRLCKNKKAICKSLFLDVQSVYDAIALDKKFREDYIAADQIKKRKTKLNDALLEAIQTERHEMIDSLVSKIDQYQK